METSFRTGYAPISPRSSDSPTSSQAPAHAAGVTVPLEAMQLPSAASLAGEQPTANDAQSVRERIGPDTRDSDPAGTLDLSRVGRNAMVSAIAQGGSFGLAFSLNNYLRVTAHPIIKQLAGFLSPIVAGFLTSPAETAVRKVTGMNATALPEGSSSWWHDAIPSVVLFSINKAYAKSRRLPKFAPNTPAGMGTTLLLSVVGTGLAGALGEASAQKAGGHREQSPLDTRATIERGMARAVTLVPMGAANFYAARHLVNKGQLPPNLGLKPLGVGVTGWAGRNKLGGWFSSRPVKSPLSTPQNVNQGTPPASPQPTSQSPAPSITPPTVQGTPQANANSTASSPTFTTLQPQSPQPRTDPPSPRDGW